MVMEVRLSIEHAEPRQAIGVLTTGTTRRSRAPRYLQAGSRNMGTWHTASFRRVPFLSLITQSPASGGCRSAGGPFKRHTNHVLTLGRCGAPERQRIASEQRDGRPAHKS